MSGALLALFNFLFHIAFGGLFLRRVFGLLHFLPNVNLVKLFFQGFQVIVLLKNVSVLFSKLLRLELGLEGLVEIDYPFDLGFGNRLGQVRISSAIFQRFHERLLFLLGAYCHSIILSPATFAIIFVLRNFVLILCVQKH